MNLLSLFNRTKKETSNNELGKRPIRILGTISLLIVLLGVLFVLLFGANLSGKATAFMWILACLLAGASIGFLFGIPKIYQRGPDENASASEKSYQQQVNTNLTEISDWLTKIIVGLGLINLTKIPPYLNSIAKTLGSALDIKCEPGNCTSLAFAYGIIISYFLLGFLYGYIVTRLYLATAFADADRDAMLAKTDAKADTAIGAAQSAMQKITFTDTKVVVDKSESTEDNKNSLKNLSQEYISLRKSMGSGSLRTQKMTEIFKKMVELAINDQNINPSDYLKSANIGDRLVGYAVQYARLSSNNLTDLVKAITTDNTPFGQYWGIISLGKTIFQNQIETLSPELYNDLLAYLKNLDKGTDREYELSKILKDLKQ